MLFRGFFGCIALLLFTLTLRAQVSVIGSSSFDGTYWDYSYTATLTPTGTEGAFELDFNDIPGLVPDATQIGSPANWTPVADFSANDISWIDDTFADDISSTPLAGFTFKSTFGPGGSLSFDAILEDDMSDTLGTLDGSTSGPLAPTPEPSAWIMVLAGAGCLALLGLRARAKSPGVRGLSILGLLFSAVLSAAPTVAVQVAGAPSWAPDITVRAATPAQLQANVSGVSGNLALSWQQLSGPTTLRWTGKTTASPTISGTVFGEYSVSLTATDATGATTADLTFGAVPSDAAGVVTPPSNDVAFLFAPMIRWGASPWPWLDERNRALADGFENLILNDPDFNAADWNNPLSGTISSTLGSFTINGTGTTFQQDFCGGVGNTSALPNTQMVIWYPAPGGGTGRYPVTITSCPSQTQVTLQLQFPLSAPYATSVAYSKISCVTCWAAGASSYINFYDNVLAFYGLYYRSGRTEYLTYARNLAALWYQSTTLDQGRIFTFGGRTTQAPKDMELIGVMWWASETGQTSVWTSLYPGLDSYAAYQASAGAVGDVREESFEFAYLAVAARLAPDPSKRESYQTAVGQALTNRWIPSQQPGGYYLEQFGYQPGTVNVTNGSDLVTINGASFGPDFWPTTFYFWVAYDYSFTNGDTDTYYQPTYVSPTSFQLPRPYTGQTATARPWQYFIFDGQGVQPFFDAITVRAMDLAYRATSDVRALNINVTLANWLANNAIQIDAKAIYYGLLFRNCTPIHDAILWCSYDPNVPGIVSTSQVSDDIASGRYNLSLFLGGWSAAQVNAPSASFAAAVDLATGGSFGKLGGPDSDAAYNLYLDSSVERQWFKDMGIFFGFGQAYAWPAARTGTPNSLINGR